MEALPCLALMAAAVAMAVVAEETKVEVAEETKVEVVEV